MRELPRPGEMYRHFKGTLYEVVAIARHTETMEELVIYRNTGKPGAVYARPMTMFMSTIDREKYPDAPGEYRFERTDETGRILHEGGPAPGSGLREGRPASGSGLREGRPVPGGESGKAEPAPEEIPEGVSRDLIRFLDEDDFEEKLLILDEIKASVDDGMASAMAASLDLALNEGSVEDKLGEIRNYLLLQMKYDGKHLRERNH